MNKVLVILGPTASGKSELAVELAKKFNGEIISADSRQVYKGLDIGTGKVPRDKMSASYKSFVTGYLYKNIPHHLLDVASPKKIFTVVQYKKLAEKAIGEIIKKGKLPILCGGTGFYIQAIVDDISIPEVKSNNKLRKKLEKKSVEELASILKKLDPKRHKTIDTKNPRRLIRAIEIAKALGKVPSLKKKKKFDALLIGTKTEDIALKQKINRRIKQWLKQGLIEEVKKLHNPPARRRGGRAGGGLSWKRLESIGLEYKYVALYLQGKLSKNEMIKKMETETWRYAKRQKTWFKKDKRIQWFVLKDKKKIEEKIKNFLKLQGSTL